ncbi:MAG: pyridoxine 5'-phosphate synthase [Bdellovibrionales bacterium GWA2_49_15]|nr:MAG: pyridoxine 5'-phosphate synthase [Bdellovibrionales bacterium GWA2_49_15]HAZ12619.1 pyridoxine 5'-phosphate synthase [Bdellovibrionales bacterium]
MTAPKITPRLGVNIDHVATLRQARGELYPSVVDAARICLEQGADQITIHLREDRRHIQDTDVESVGLVTKKFEKPLNLEMGCSDGIIEIALAVVPDWICLVPENRQERTTEGGLNIKNEATYQRVLAVCQRFKKILPTTRISLFVESDQDTLDRITSLAPSIDAVEIHTGHFARDFISGNDLRDHLKQYKTAHEHIKRLGLSYHAGHGLTGESVVPLLEAKIFEEYNIGHWIIAEAVFKGLGAVVRDLNNLIKQYS